MSKKVFILIIIGISLLLGIGIIVSSLMQSQSTSSSKQETVSPSPVVQGSSSGGENQMISPAINSPEDVVKSFYTSYISYNGNPLMSRMYDKSPFLTSSFKQTINGFVANSSSSDYDPIFCTANKTKNPAFEPAVYNETNTQTTVIIHDGDIDGGKSVYRVSLKQIRDKWLIDDIMCLP